jgi:hypothetical protein
VLNLLYHNYPGQRTLVVAHSNQALNDVFQKTIERDVPARYLLRLGMGQEDLDTTVDFSRTGALSSLPCPWKHYRAFTCLQRIGSMARRWLFVVDNLSCQLCFTRTLVLRIAAVMQCTTRYCCCRPASAAVLMSQSFFTVCRRQSVEHIHVVQAA